MTTSTQDKELDYELQELYLTGKQWLGDIEFMKSEEAFLNHLLNHQPICHEKRTISIQLEQAALLQQQLNTEVVDFIKQLEPLIMSPCKQIGLQFIEDFMRLQATIAGALNSLKAIKYQFISLKNAA